MPRDERACLKGCLSKIGISVNFLKARRRIERDEPALAGRPTLLWRGWVADFPDPDNFLRPLFHSQSPVNVSAYRNPQVDQLLDRAWTETSYIARIDLYRDIERRILADSPIIPVHYGRTRVLVQPDTRGFSLSQLGFHYVPTHKIWLANQPHPKIRL
jgi:ABC-type oligopeptide transport system substrate-binding subunit